ncbi:unnamed protein product [Closterium sp. NIES-65]|nr:unnamed protein product [Closterium sp. NIES-65]
MRDTKHSERVSMHYLNPKGSGCCAFPSSSVSLSSSLPLSLSPLLSPTSTDALAPHLASSPSLTTISLHRCFSHTRPRLLPANLDHCLSFSLFLSSPRPLSSPVSLSPSLPSSSPPAQTHWRLISPPPPPSPPSPGTAASASHPTPPVLFPSLPPLPPHPTSTDALAPHLAASPALTTISLHRCFGLSPHTVSLLLEASRKPGSVLTALVFSHVDRLSVRHVAPPDTAIPSAAQSDPPKEDEDGRMSFLGLTQKREEEGEWWEMTCKGGGGEWGLGSCALTRVSPALPLRPLPLVHVLTRFPSFTAHPPSRPPSTSPQPHLTSLLPSSTLSSAPTPFFPAFPLSALLPSALSQSAAAHSLPARVLQLLAFSGSCFPIFPHASPFPSFSLLFSPTCRPSVLRRLKTLLLSRALCCPHNGLLCLSGSCFPILSLTRSLPAFLHSCYSPNLLPSFQALCCPHFELLCLTPFTTILCFPSSLIPSLCHSLSHPIALPSLFPPTPLTTPPVAGPHCPHLELLFSLAHPPSRPLPASLCVTLFSPSFLPHLLFAPSHPSLLPTSMQALNCSHLELLCLGGSCFPILPDALPLPSLSRLLLSLPPRLVPSSLLSRLASACPLPSAADAAAAGVGGVQWGEGEARRQVQLGGLQWGVMQAGGVQWGAVQPGGVQWGEGEARRQVQLGEMRAGLGELRLGVWGGREAQRQVQLGEMRAGLGELRLGAWGGREAQRQPRGQVQRQVRPGEALGGVAVLLERLQLVEVSFWEKGEVDDMRDVISSLPHPPLLLDLSTDRGALIAAHISRHAARIHARAAQGVSHAAAHTRWHLPSFAGASGQVVAVQATAAEAAAQERVAEAAAQERVAEAAAPEVIAGQVAIAGAAAAEENVAQVRVAEEEAAETIEAAAPGTSAVADRATSPPPAVAGANSPSPAVAAAAGAARHLCRQCVRATRPVRPASAPIPTSDECCCELDWLGKVLLQAGADMAVGNRGEETPLYIASLKCHLWVVRQLLTHTHTLTPLRHSVSPSLPHSQVLLQAGADMAVGNRGEETPLYIASLKCHLWVVRQLLTHTHTLTPLRHSVSPSLPHSQVLLQAGADMAVGNRGEETPLYIASLKGHLWVVRRLLGHCRRRGLDWQGDASLHRGAAAGALQEARAGLAGRQMRAFTGEGHLWVVRRLLGHCRRRGLDWQGDVSLHRGGSGWTPLMAAALSNHTHVLHSSYSFPSAPPMAIPFHSPYAGSGWTPLMAAALSNHTHVLHTLLTHHVHTHQSQDDTSSPALINKQNTYGLTALHIAARYGSLDCIQSLLAAGAFTAVPDLYGERPSGLARRFGHSEAVQLLLAVEGVEIGLGGEEDGDNGSKGGDEGKDGKGGKGKRARRKGRKAKGIEEN